MPREDDDLDGEELDEDGEGYLDAMDDLLDGLAHRDEFDGDADEDEPEDEPLEEEDD